MTLIIEIALGVFLGGFLLNFCGGFASGLMASRRRRQLLWEVGVERTKQLEARCRQAAEPYLAVPGFADAYDAEFQVLMKTVKDKHAAQLYKNYDEKSLATLSQEELCEFLKITDGIAQEVLKNLPRPDLASGLTSSNSP